MPFPASHALLSVGVPFPASHALLSVGVPFPASHALLSVGVPFPQPGSYIQDFVSRAHKQVPLRDNRVIQDVTPQQCAKLCVQEGSFTCNSFDYCGNFSECRLSDASVANVGQVTLQSSAYCDVYSREYDVCLFSSASHCEE